MHPTKNCRGTLFHKCGDEIGRVPCPHLTEGGHLSHMACLSINPDFLMPNPFFLDTAFCGNPSKHTQWWFILIVILTAFESHLWMRFVCVGFHRSVTEVGRPMLNVDFTAFHWLSPGEGKKTQVESTPVQPSLLPECRHNVTICFKFLMSHLPHHDNSTLKTTSKDKPFFPEDAFCHNNKKSNHYTQQLSNP